MFSRLLQLQSGGAQTKYIPTIYTIDRGARVRSASLGSSRGAGPKQKAPQGLVIVLPSAWTCVKQLEIAARSGPLECMTPIPDQFRTA